MSSPKKEKGFTQRDNGPVLQTNQYYSERGGPKPSSPTGGMIGPGGIGQISFPLHLSTSNNKIGANADSSLYKILKNTQANHINFKKLGELKQKSNRGGESLKKTNVGQYQIVQNTIQSGSKCTSRLRSQRNEQGSNLPTSRSKKVR